MKVSLVVLSAGKSAGQAIPVTLAQFIIGRDPQCNLRPASAVISKRHCAILIKNGKVSVRDFDSTNGTFVNDAPVKGEFPLDHEDILKVGPLAFRVVIEKTTPVNKPTPPPAKSTPATDDDNVAAMLLSLQEDSVEGEPSATGDDSDVPGGSTIMDMVPLPPETTTEIPKPQTAAKPAAATPAKPAATGKAAAGKAAAGKAAAGKSPAPAAAPDATQTPAAEDAKPEEKPAEKPAEKKPDPASGNARDAARAILEKYVKRHRG